MIHASLLSLTLWADFSVFKSMGSEFRGRRAQIHSSDIWMGLALLVGAGIGIWLLTKLVRHQDRKRRQNSPMALFRALCKAHQLDRRSRQLLRRLADRRGLRQPAMVFVDPARFEPSELGVELKPRAAEVRALAKLLFAAPEEPAKTAPPAEAAVPVEAPSVLSPTSTTT